MNTMFNLNRMPYKGLGRTGGKNVSWVGMLVLLLVALLVLPSCFGDGDTVVTGPECGEGTELNAARDMCVPTVDPTPTPTCDQGTTEDDELGGGTFAENICGLAGNDTITGSDEGDMLMGDAGNDTLYGKGGNDVLKGGDGNDKLHSGAGNDKLYGGDGDDELTVEGGSNMLDGGDGDDFAIYLSTEGVRADLSTGTARHLAEKSTKRFESPGGGDDTLKSIENVKGSHESDELTGDDRNNILKGLDGDDQINGGDGDDTIIPNRPMQPALNDDEDGLADGEVERSDGEDTINGGDDVDTVSYEGEAATFTADGVAVAVRGLVIDLSATEASGDTPPRGLIVAADGSMAHITAALGASGATEEVLDKIVAENKGTADEPDWVSTIENVIGGDGDDTITGDERDNELTGGPGADALSGGPGVDILYAGNGDTVLNGGSTPDDTATDDVDESKMENDTVSYEKVTDWDTTTDGNQGVTLTDTTEIVEVENLVGSSLDDTITVTTSIAMVNGGKGDDTITGYSTGRDMLVGGAGTDTLDGGGGGDTPAAGFSKDMADVLVGGPGNDVLNGNSTASTEVFAVHAGGGNDTINNFQLSATDTATPPTPATDPDHLHIIDFTGMPDCSLQSGGTVVFCDLPNEQRITINVVGNFSTSPLNLVKELKIVVVPPEDS